MDLAGLGMTVDVKTAVLRGTKLLEASFAKKGATKLAPSKEPVANTSA
jgi:hypothetical protein